MSRIVLLLEKYSSTRGSPTNNVVCFRLTSRRQSVWIFHPGDDLRQLRRAGRLHALSGERLERAQHGAGQWFSVCLLSPSSFQV